MTKSPSRAMINEVRHDIHPSASVVGGLILINLLQDLATKVQESLFCDLRDERAKIWSCYESPVRLCPASPGWRNWQTRQT
jgi:hypothetical protein